MTVIFLNVIFEHVIFLDFCICKDTDFYICITKNIVITCLRNLNCCDENYKIT